jgi:hypothetical protein
MPQICDGGGAEGALGALDEELVPLQLAKHGVDETQVVRPGLAVD